MIERVARCFQNLERKTCREPTKQIRSRRHLHSSFWSHGAGNIDLPAWWIFLLQTPACRDGSHRGNRRGQFRDVVSTRLHDIFLDFLYPVQTLALIRRLKRSTTAYHDAAKKVKRYSRSYTSIAKDFITVGDLDGVEDVQEESLQPGSKTKGSLQRRMNIILDAKEHEEPYDELWQTYQDMIEDSQILPAQQLVKILRFLVVSKRDIDSERAVALFESIPVSERRAIHYSHAVSAALKIQDLDTAVSIHREALSRINGSVGTSSILRYAVGKEVWFVAIEIWHAFWGHKLAYYSRPDIWAGLNTLPLNELISKATSAAKFVTTVSESADSTGAVAAREFAIELIRHTFCRKGGHFDISQHNHLIDEAIKLDPHPGDLISAAIEQLLSINEREYGHRALHLYRLSRNETSFSPTRRALDAVTNRLCEVRSTPGILMVLDDWRTHFARVTPRIAKNAAFVLAMNGQLEALQKLFQDFVSQHGKPQDHWFYHYLLQVHNRRADTQGILHCLNDLRKQYAFKPGLKAWNLVIATFARVGDVDGTLTYYSELLDHGLRADSTTYFHLMSMYSKRGDRDAVDRLYEQSKVEGVPLIIGMIDTLVLANIKDERLEEAEWLVDHALQMDLKGARTYMWNVLLNAYALRKDVERVSQTHRKMRDAGVPADSATYAALLTSLCVAKYPDAARKIMTDVMRRHKFKRTAMHYAIVMGGYLTTKEYSIVFKLYKQMLEEGLRPNMSTQNVLLRAAASVDKQTSLTTDDTVDSEMLSRARQTFEQTVANLDPMELAESGPRKSVGTNPLNEAFSSTYFDYMIFLYGKEAAFSKVSEVYERYITDDLPLRSSGSDVGASLPIRLTSALMVSHLQAGDYKEIDRCWKLALEKTKQLARPSNVQTLEHRWVLRPHRFIINLPLHQYIASLDAQHRTADLISTIDNLRSAGYALNNANWNTHIQALAKGSRAQDNQLAFELCERNLMPNWYGWGSLGSPNWFKPKLRAAARDMLLKQDQSAPAYLTLVWLARVYLEAKSRGLSGTMRRLEKAGPRTVDALLNMPKLHDRPQSEILRQER